MQGVREAEEHTEHCHRGAMPGTLLSSWFAFPFHADPVHTALPRSVAAAGTCITGEGDTEPGEGRVSCCGVDHLATTQWQGGAMSVSAEVDGCKVEICGRVPASLYPSVALKVWGQLLNTAIADGFCDSTV